MILDANEFEKSTELVADFCILGGGVAGVVLANELLKNSDKNIIVLESGGEFFDERTQELYKANSIPPFFPDTTVSRLRMLGGSSNHWENSIERFSPIDFEKREWISDSGWPIEYADLVKHYPAAEQYCNVQNGEYDFSFWNQYIKSTDIFENSPHFSTVVSKSPNYPTQFFEDHGSKLVESPKVKIVQNANVIDIAYSDLDEHVESVTFRTFSETRHMVRATTFIMCFGGIENARMLLTFNERYENKLGNQNDNVGRYFMEHPTIRAAQLIPFKEKLVGQFYEGAQIGDIHIRGRAYLNDEAQRQYQTNNLRAYFIKQSKLILSDGVSSSHIIADSLTDGEVPEDFGGHLLNTLKDIDHIAESFFKKKLDTSVFDSVHELGGYQILAMIEQTPDRNNRITLSNSKDSLGIKSVDIKFHVTQEDKNWAWKTLTLLSQDPGIQSVGRLRLLKERESRIWESQLGYGQHHIGTTKMGNTSQNGVVDSSLKVFGTKNFYISGSSVFPTGSHVPPTLTIVALSIKLAQELSRSA